MGSARRGDEGTRISAASLDLGGTPLNRGMVPMLVAPSGGPGGARVGSAAVQGVADAALEKRAGAPLGGRPPRSATLRAEALDQFGE
jgi:hypothetical protein